MQLSTIISSNAVLPNLKASSKRQLLQELAQEGARLTGLDAQVIFETLLRREKLGSTGLGQGIAIPHGKFQALEKVHGLFARLATPIKSAVQASDQQNDPLIPERPQGGAPVADLALRLA